MISRPIIKKKQRNEDHIEELDEDDLEHTAPPPPSLPEYSIIIDSDNFRTIKVRGEYYVYLSTEIGSSSVYVPIISFFRALSKNDKVTIFVNSPGGQVSTAVQIIHAIQECKAKTKAVIDSECMSMAPLIALSCKEIVVNPFALIMFHDTSGGVIRDKTNAVMIQQQALNKHYRLILTKLAGKILTDEEITQLLHGKDFYFTQKEFLKRLRGNAPAKKKRIDIGKPKPNKFDTAGIVTKGVKGK
jgi:ATP-dependent protease ClpP protease subunit